MGLEEFGSGGVGCTCHPEHVYGCQKPGPCQWSVQRGVWGWSRLYQGSVLSPLLFIHVLEALSRQFRTSVPWELLYADDLVVMADSLEECIARLKVWKEGMEGKGLRVNMKKTKFMVSEPGLDLHRDSGFPCAVCLNGVGVNSIQCSQCMYWVLKKCSVVRGRLAEDPGYVCPRCCDQARPIDNRPVTQVDVDGTLLDVESNFCYLGDMLCAGRGCKLTIVTRCSTAWRKFKRLLPILTSKHVSLRKSSMPVYVLPYYMVVKPRHLLRQTCSSFAGTTDYWSAGSAESEMMRKCLLTHSV